MRLDQAAAQRAAGAVQQVLDALLGDAELRGDLRERLLLDLALDQRLAVQRRQQRERLADDRGVLGLDHRVVRLVVGEDVDRHRLEVDQARPALVGAVAVDAEVGDGAAAVGQRLQLVAELGQREEQPQERLLHHLVDVARVAQEPAGVQGEGAAVPEVEAGEVVRVGAERPGSGRTGTSATCGPARASSSASANTGSSGTGGRTTALVLLRLASCSLLIIRQRSDVRGGDSDAARATAWVA